MHTTQPMHVRGNLVLGGEYGWVHMLLLAGPCYLNQAHKPIYYFIPCSWQKISFVSCCVLFTAGYTKIRQSPIFEI